METPRGVDRPKASGGARRTQDRLDAVRRARLGGARLTPCVVGVLSRLDPAPAFS